MSWKTSANWLSLLSMAASNHVYGVRRGANRRRNRRLGGQIVRAKDRQVCPTSGVRQSCRDGEGERSFERAGTGAARRARDDGGLRGSSGSLPSSPGALRPPDRNGLGERGARGERQPSQEDSG